MTTRSSITMLTKVEQYITHSRSSGYKFETESHALRSFARYADLHAPGKSLTTELAERWATSSKLSRRAHQSKRLGIVRGLAEYLVKFDPKTEIPPLGLLGPSGGRRFTPRIYTSDEIAMLIRECRTRWASSSRYRSFIGTRNATVIGLLACTGLRIGEAMALTNRDVKLKDHLITVRESKNLPMRLVPITACAADQLRRYREVRDKLFGRCDLSEVFFRTFWGTPLHRNDMEKVFRQLREWTDLKGSSGRAPRLHDLRHTFACNHLLRAYREKRDIDNAVHDLSIYLGHAKLVSTYWYLSAVPELMKLSAGRFEEHYLHIRNGGKS